MNYGIDNLLAQDEEAEKCVNQAKHLLCRAAFEIDVTPMEILDWLRYRMLDL